MSQSKIRILYVHHAKGWGGAPKSLIELIKNIDKDQFEVQVLLIFDSEVTEYLKREGIQFKVAKSRFYSLYYKCFVHSEAEYLSRYKFHRIIEFSIIWFLSKYFFAFRELKNFDYDICHLNSLVLTDWLFPASKFGKVIMHVREPFKKGRFSLRSWYFKHEINRFVDRIVAISKDNAMRIGNLKNTHVVYNSARILPKSNNPVSYSSKKFLYLGGNQEIKGFNTLVNSLDYLDNDIKILFAGNYNINEAYRNNVMSFFKRKKDLINSINKVKCHKNSEYIGIVNDISSLLVQVSCVIVPHTKPHFPRAVIEAYLASKPVITSDVEGMSEIVNESITGFLFKNGDAIKLAETINEISKNPMQLKVLGENAFNYAKSLFTNDNIKLIQNIYFELFYERKK